MDRITPPKPDENLVTALVSRLVRYRTLRLVIVLWIVTTLLAVFIDTTLIVTFDLGMLDESQMGGEIFDTLYVQYGSLLAVCRIRVSIIASA